MYTDRRLSPSDSVLSEMADDVKHIKDRVKCVPSAEFRGKPPAECLNEWRTMKAQPESSILLLLQSSKSKTGRHIPVYLIVTSI